VDEGAGDFGGDQRRDRARREEQGAGSPHARNYTARTGGLVILKVL
jgi:hypothetical protein